MDKYTKLSGGRNALNRDGLFEIERFRRPDGKLFSELADDLRLKRFLKRAVEKDFAPQSLIDSIKTSVRR